jgi:hypothetical protein
MDEDTETDASRGGQGENNMQPQEETNTTRKDIKEMSHKELQELLTEMGEPTFRCK